MQTCVRGTTAGATSFYVIVTAMVFCMYSLFSVRAVWLCCAATSRGAQFCCCYCCWYHFLFFVLFWLVFVVFLLWCLLRCGSAGKQNPSPSGLPRRYEQVFVFLTTEDSKLAWITAAVAMLLCYGVLSLPRGVMDFDMVAVRCVLPRCHHGQRWCAPPPPPAHKLTIPV